MVFYEQSILDEIRNRVSIVSFIGEHIPLKKAGRNFKGICPFHSEKDSSFMVSDEKQIFHCFGCGEGGNVFSFVMKYDGVSFREAVEVLASRAGVELPKEDETPEKRDHNSQIAKKKKYLLRVNEIASEFFQNSLKSAPENSGIANYLKLRGISDDISTQHFLGYADDNWNALANHLSQKNVPLELAEELGLVKRKSSGDYYDFFRNRLVFPIISHRLEILGFGGRVLPDEKDSNMAKYLNSPDSIIYHKSHSVYGLNVANSAIRENDQVIIVEGYMDAIALNLAGIFNVVAPLGTAVTTGHIRLLGRYTKNMVLLFDGDSAGIKAAERALPSFLEVGIMPKIVILPNGDDPDDWLKEHSGSELLEIINSAATLFEWFIFKQAEEAGADPTKRFKRLTEIQSFFEKIENAIEFTFYRKKLADAFKMDENDLLHQFEYKAGSGISCNRAPVGKLATENFLLKIMIEYPEYIYKISENVDAAYFTDASYRTIYELICKLAKDGKFSVGGLLDYVADEALTNTIQSLSINDDEIGIEDASVIVEDCIRHITKSSLEVRLKNITEAIKEAEKARDEDRVIKLMSEKNKLISHNA